MLYDDDCSVVIAYIHFLFDLIIARQSDSFGYNFRHFFWVFNSHKALKGLIYCLQLHNYCWKGLEAEHLHNSN